MVHGVKGLASPLPENGGDVWLEESTVHCLLSTGPLRGPVTKSLNRPRPQTMFYKEPRRIVLEGNPSHSRIGEYESTTFQTRLLKFLKHLFEFLFKSSRDSLRLEL